ncbi:MFS transporter [soil metagenome]
MSATFKSFAIANYRVWFAAVTVSNVGTWMQRTAQDWIVLTQLTDNDAAAVGVTMALQFVPQLVLSPLTGLVSDLVDRRRLLLLTQAVMGVLGLALGLLTVLGVLQLWMVMVFALALGITSSFDAPARQTFVADLVPADHLSNAVGLNATSFNLARLSGPAAAGLLTATIGAGWVFLINAATFAATIVGLLVLRRAHAGKRERPARGPGQMRAGFDYVRRRGDLLLVFGMVALMGTFGMNFPIYISTMSVEFDGDAWLFGILSSALAVGSLTGALFAARRERPRLRSITLASAGFGLGLIAASLMPGPIAFGVVLAVLGVCAISMLNSSNAYVQTTTDPAVRGRVMSLYMAIFVGGTFIGAPLVGWVANLAGPRWAMNVGAAAGLLAAAVAAAYYLRMRRRVLRDTAAAASGPAVVPADRDEAAAEIAVTEAESQR